MNIETLKISFACFLGAFIGAFCAPQFGATMWPIGIIIGGILGYLSYEFGQVKQATCRVCSEVWKKIWENKHVCAARQWMRKNFLGYVGKGARLFVIGLLFLAAALIILTAVSNALLLFESVFIHHWTYYQAIDSGWFYGAGTAFVILCGAACYNSAKDEEGSQTILYLSIVLSPALAPVLALVMIPALFCWLLYVIYLARTSALEVLIMVYSEVRMLCLVWAAIGAFIGYLIRNPLVGALAGATFGLMHYKLVLAHLAKLAKRQVKAN